MITGDIAFHQGLLPVFEDTDTAGKIETREKSAVPGAQILVPGHGTPTGMAKATRYTRDYLAYMREQVIGLFETGGTLQDVREIDQSGYAHRGSYDELARLNASLIFHAMEF